MLDNSTSLPYNGTIVNTMEKIMKTYNYTNWKNYLIHLLNEKKISDSEALNLFLNTASQAEVYIALEKGDLVDEREAEKFQDFFTAETFAYKNRIKSA